MTRRICAVLWLVLAGNTALGQLIAGDIAFVMYGTDGNDSFSWVTFRQIPANTVIHFTDSSVSNGYFRWTEHLGDVVSPGPLCWSHTNAVAAGTVIRWLGGASGGWTLGQASGGRMSLSSSGDQLVAYRGVIAQDTSLPAPWQGDASGATLLHALNFANNGWDNVNGGSTSVSCVPPGLCTNAGTAVHVSALDNGYYDGITAGTPRELLAAIANPANWRTSNDVFEVVAWMGDRAFDVKPPGTVFSIK